MNVLQLLAWLKQVQRHNREVVWWCMQAFWKGVVPSLVMVSNPRCHPLSVSMLGYMSLTKCCT